MLGSGVIEKKQMAKATGGEGFRFFVITGLKIYLITGFQFELAGEKISL